MGSDDTRNEKPDWRLHGLRIVRSGELDSNTPQTLGMERAEAISRARVGAQKLWAGTVEIVDAVLQSRVISGFQRHIERPCAV